MCWASNPDQLLFHAALRVQTPIMPQDVGYLFPALYAYLFLPGERPIGEKFRPEAYILRGENIIA